MITQVANCIGSEITNIWKIVTGAGVALESYIVIILHVTIFIASYIKHMHVDTDDQGNISLTFLRALKPDFAL